MAIPTEVWTEQLWFLNMAILDIADESVVVPAVNRGASGSFFVWIAGLLLLINLIGFSSTYFLKEFLGTPELPLRTHIHGGIFTSWFVLFLVQTALISRRNFKIHRRVGIVGSMLAIAMVISGLIMIYEGAMVYHDPDSGVTLEMTATFVWANLVLLSAFAIFVTLGISLRRRPEAHKRLMLLASLSMMLQSLARIGKIPLLQLVEPVWLNEVIIGLGGLFLLLLTLVVFDVVIRRRPHPASLWGAPLLLVSIIFAAVIVPTTKFGQSLVLVFS